MAHFFPILEKLSSRAKNALLNSQKLSEELSHGHIGSEHLLYGILQEGSSFASELLQKNKISLEVVKAEIMRINIGNAVSTWQPKLSNDFKEVLEKAAITAAKYQYQFIGTEHMLYGFLETEHNRALGIMQNLKISVSELRKNLAAIFVNLSKFPDLTNASEGSGFAGVDTLEQRHTKTPALDYFTTDLSKKAIAGKIDPVIGRKQEIERVISILNRRTKNNPVLIGEPGVGKTAIVEGLALSISRGEVPDSLLDRKILALDMALVVAGSMFRGEFEQRLKQVIDEVRDNSSIILFIDELHTIVGAGATTGSLDAANILKPALARGEIRVIGATTLTEYRKHIEHDAALERRFQPILVEEPSMEESLDILKGVRPNYEKHHDIKITDEAIKAAVELSSRYITDRFLPDKALDLVDETAAFIKTVNIRMRGPRVIKKIEAELKKLEEEKTKAVMQQDFTTALHLKSLEDKLKRQRDVYALEASKKTGRGYRITGEDIAQTVSKITKIPLTKLLKTESKKLINLEKILTSRIIGQEDTIKTIASAIRRSRAGISSPMRPIASFLFLGPTGVGKSETAKVLAQEVFEDKDALIRVDMSEFMERHNVSRLIGAPAGYVGYDEGGRLTEEIRRKPYAVILFDEIEKAHPDVFNILLQILEEGELTDASGKKVNFRNTIIIMTSNLGISDFNKQASDFGFAFSSNTDDLFGKRKKAETDYEKVKNQVLESLKQTIRPELLNRIDKILVFKPLGLDEIKKVVSLELNYLSDRVKDQQQVSLIFDKDTVAFIAAKSSDPQQGARYIRRNIQEFIEDPLAEKIITGFIKPGDTTTAVVKNNEVVFS
jgi:ATP-dependent Clp protease ATP-binding subunit ClpC